MVGFFSFLLVVSAVAFVVSAVLLVVRAMKKKPKKPVAVMAAASVLLFVISFVGIGVTYNPTPEQIAERERIAAEKEAAKAERERQKAEEAARKEAEESAQREAKAAQSESQGQTAEPSAPSESPVQSEPSEPVSPSAPTESEPPAESENPAHSDAPATSSPAETEPEKPSAPTESEPPNSENPLLGGYDSLTEKILYNAQISECPVMNGTKTERIGSYGRIIMSKDDMKALTSGQFFKYAEEFVCSFQGTYNWFTIKFNDGTGIIFPGCFLSFDYGELNEYGEVENRLGAGFMNASADGFDYYTVEELEAME